MNNQGHEGGGDNAPDAHANPVVGAIESLDDYVRRNGIRHADENGMYIIPIQANICLMLMFLNIFSDQSHIYSIFVPLSLLR